VKSTLQIFQSKRAFFLPPCACQKMKYLNTSVFKFQCSTMKLKFSKLDPVF